MLVAAALVAAIVVPPARLASMTPPCLIRTVTSRRCPACGMSTSWTLLAHLRVVDAFRAHPLGPVAFALAVRVLAR